MDLAANTSDVQGVTYEEKTATGETRTFTLPCGSPIPAGAVCVCNCVAGGYVPSGGGGGVLTYWYPN